MDCSTPPSARASALASSMTALSKRVSSRVSRIRVTAMTERTARTQSTRMRAKPAARPFAGSAPSEGGRIFCRRNGRDPQRQRAREERRERTFVAVILKLVSSRRRATPADDVENLSQIWAVAPALVKLALRDVQPSQKDKEPPWKRIAKGRRWAM